MKSGSIVQIQDCNTERSCSPNDVWKSGTITSILTNPIYAGHTAYKRREHKSGKYRRLVSDEWVLSVESNDNITIIDGNATYFHNKETDRLHPNDLGHQRLARTLYYQLSTLPCIWK